MLHQLLEDFPQAQPEEVSSSRHGVSSGASPWGTCMAFFRTNPDMKRLESSLGPGLRSYDPGRAVTPAGALHFVSPYSTVGPQHCQYPSALSCIIAPISGKTLFCLTMCAQQKLGQGEDEADMDLAVLVTCCLTGHLILQRAQSLQSVLNADGVLIPEASNSCYGWAAPAGKTHGATPNNIHPRIMMRVHGAVQGSQLAGGSEEGVRVEGTPLTLLEGVTDFLIHQRAALRKEGTALRKQGTALPHGRPESAAANAGVSCAAAFAFGHSGSMLVHTFSTCNAKTALMVHQNLCFRVASMTFLLNVVLWMTGSGGQAALPSLDFQRKMMPRDQLAGPPSGLIGPTCHAFDPLS